jgi:hypothetical protein
MQSNAQYGQPLVMGQGSQEAMHNAMLQQQQQYNNQSAQIAGQPNGLSRMMAPLQQYMMAKALRDGAAKKDGDPTNGITERNTGIAYDQNGQNPYAYTPQGPDYSQNFGNLISTKD